MEFGLPSKGPEDSVDTRSDEGPFPDLGHSQGGGENSEDDV